MKLWRRLRARLARRLVEESYWNGWEAGKVEAIHGLASRIEGGQRA